MGKEIVNKDGILKTNLKENHFIPIVGIEVAENESNDIYMTLTMPVATTRKNLNGLKFTSEFFENKKDSLVDMPLLVNREKLESGQTENLGHEFDGIDFHTDAIGVIYSTWIEDLDSDDSSDDIKVLMASAKVWKRYGATCSAIVDLYESEELEFSMELLATDIMEYSDRREVKDGSFIGHTIVSNGAERACATNQLLVAEAYVKDIESMENLDEKGGADLGIENAGMSVDMIYSKINTALGYDMWISQLFLDDMKFVAYNYNEKTYQIMEFTMDGEEVAVNFESAKSGSLIWKDKEELENDDLQVAEGEEENKETEPVVEEPVVEDASAISEEEPIVEEVIEPTEPIENAEVETSEKEVEYAEEIIKLTKRVEALESIEEKYNALVAEQNAEKLEELKQDLTQMAENALSKDDEMTEGMKNAIENANENELKIAIAEYFMANKQTFEPNVEDEEIIETSEKEGYETKEIEMF